MLAKLFIDDKIKNINVLQCNECHDVIALTSDCVYCAKCVNQWLEERDEILRENKNLKIKIKILKNDEILKEYGNNEKNEH